METEKNSPTSLPPEPVGQKRQDPYPTPNVQIPTVGRIVDYFPAIAGGVGIKLPNSMKKAPAIINQIFAQDSPINLSVFVADINEPVRAAFSVPHKSSVSEGNAYWDWPARV